MQKMGFHEDWQLMETRKAFEHAKLEAEEIHQEREKEQHFESYPEVRAEEQN